MTLEAFRMRLAENLGLRLLSLALAIVAWLFVSGERTHEVTVVAPVDYILPDGLILLNDDPPPQQVVLKATGNRAALRQLQERLREVAVSYLVDVEHVGKGSAVHSFRRPPAGIPSQIQIDTVAPAEVELVFDEVMTREVAVDLRTIGSLPQGYVERRRGLSPAVVSLVGAKSELRDLERVQTLPLRLGERSSGFDGGLGLDLRGLHLAAESPDSVRVQLEVEERQGDIQIDALDVQAEALPEEYSLDPNVASVRLSGPLPVLYELQKEGLNLRLRADSKDTPLPESVYLESIEGDSGGKAAWALRLEINHERAKEVMVRHMMPVAFEVKRSENVPGTEAGNASTEGEE